MESHISQAFQEELTCFICLNCLIDPVTISCGHSFCRACLFLLQEDIEVPVHCPMCRAPFCQTDFRTNIVLKKLASVARRASLLKSLREEHRCATHKETKRMFCVEERLYLCQRCSASPEHSAHTHCAIETAAEGQMEKLLKQMVSVWEKIQENQKNLEAMNTMINQWQEYLTQREEMIRTEYRTWEPVPRKEEEQHIESMKKEGHCVCEKLRERRAMMIVKSNELKEMYQQLIAMSQEQHLLLLQDLDDMFQKNESLQLSMPQAMKPELSARPITGLTEKFQSFLGKVHFWKKASTTCKTNLFNVMRQICFGPQHENPSVDLLRCCISSWGSEGYSSGKYYWEVVVKDSWDWAVGVSIGSFLGQRNPCFKSEVKLLVCVNEGDHYNLLTTWPIMHLCIEKPVGQVGVLLDCDDRCLSFLDVAKNSLIFKFPPGSISLPVQPFFCTGKTI
ncbi:tripartite motif-containing protein 43 [Phodopus roborovskii]|uniref:Trim43a protein n=1 Tax=Phodopus roborovskii TaxID=109678 RepID=A0AAU9YRG2_PHORO|nr:tripartite motif-containing protein 43 [Phodopus roborovskii]CAH6777902.1 Trim43a [Phodopus roborovskii]